MSEGIQPLVMPKWGLAMQEGMVAQWHVEPGATVSVGQEICDIETSKIANIFESPLAGTLRRLVAEPGDPIPVGALIGIVAEAAVDDASIDAFIEEFNAKFESEGPADAAPEPKTVETPAGRLQYLELGDGEGPPVLFVHGYGGDLNNWMFNQEALSADHKTYAIDLPGHGGSTKSVGDGSLGVLVDAVVAFMDAVSIARVHLVGHSMGGAVALEVAAKAPDRAASLTMVAPAGFGPEVSHAYIDGFISQGRTKKLKAVLELLVYDPGSITAEMVEEVIRYKRLDGAVAALETLRDGYLYKEPDIAAAKAKLDALACPVQVFWGADDQIVSAAYGEGLPAKANVTVFPQTGHMPHMERAGEVNEAMAKLVGT